MIFDSCQCFIARSWRRLQALWINWQARQAQLIHETCRHSCQSASLDGALQWCALLHHAADSQMLTAGRVKLLQMFITSDDEVLLHA